MILSLCLLSMLFLFYDNIVCFINIDFMDKMYIVGINNLCQHYENYILRNIIFIIVWIFMLSSCIWIIFSSIIIYKIISKRISYRNFLLIKTLYFKFCKYILPFFASFILSILYDYLNYDILGKNDSYLCLNQNSTHIIIDITKSYECYYYINLLFSIKLFCIGCLFIGYYIYSFNFYELIVRKRKELYCV